MIRLNLGCGTRILKEWQNYDKYPKDKSVMYIDLNKPPFHQLPDDYADEILLDNVYEHLSGNEVELMMELSRVLKKGGKLTIIVPINYPIVAHEKQFFTSDYFLCLKEGFYGSLFKDVNVVFRQSSIGNMLWKLKLFFIWVTKSYVTYELIK